MRLTLLGRAGGRRGPSEISHLGKNTRVADGYMTMASIVELFSAGATVLYKVFFVLFTFAGFSFTEIPAISCRSYLIEYR